MQEKNNPLENCGYLLGSFMLILRALYFLTVLFKAFYYLKQFDEENDC